MRILNCFLQIFLYSGCCEKFLPLGAFSLAVETGPVHLEYYENSAPSSGTWGWERNNQDGKIHSGVNTEEHKF